MIKPNSPKYGTFKVKYNRPNVRRLMGMLFHDMIELGTLLMVNGCVSDATNRVAPSTWDEEEYMVRYDDLNRLYHIGQSLLYQEANHLMQPTQWFNACGHLYGFNRTPNREMCDDFEDYQYHIIKWVNNLQKTRHGLTIRSKLSNLIGYRTDLITAHQWIIQNRLPAIDLYRGFNSQLDKELKQATLFLMLLDDANIDWLREFDKKIPHKFLTRDQFKMLVINRGTSKLIGKHMDTLLSSEFYEQYTTYDNVWASQLLQKVIKDAN